MWQINKNLEPLLVYMQSEEDSLSGQRLSKDLLSGELQTHQAL